MDLTVNWIAVVIAAVGGMVVGMVWYSTLAKPWMAAAGLTEDDQLELVARVSKTGQATPQSGDWLGSIGPIASEQFTDQTLHIEINQRLP